MATNLARKSLNAADEYLQVLCDPCRFSGNTTIAKKYCSDCNGHLCPNCVSTHLKVKNTKNHSVSYIKTKRTPPTAHASSGTAHSQKKNFETKCLEHSKPVVSYCLVHDALCCRICISSSHVECRLQVLSEAASGSRDSRELRTIEAGIRRLEAKFEETQRKKQGTLQHLGLQNDTFSNAVKTYRKSLDNILDKLELNLVKGKDRHYDGKVEELRGCLKTCQDAISVLKSSLNEIDIATRQGDEQALFLTLKKVQAMSKRYEKVLMDVEKLPRNYTFHFQPDIAIEKFLKGVNDLGNIKDDSYAMNGPQIAWNVKENHNIKYGRHKAEAEEKVKSSTPSDTGKHCGRMTSPRKAISPRDSHISNPPDELNVRIQSDKKTCSITGSAFLPDDKLVVADATNKTVKLFSSNLKPITSLETSSSPRDVAMVSKSEIALTMPNEKSVTLISVGKEMSIKKTIKLEVECYGIAFYENEFFVTSGWSTEKEIQVIDSEGVVKRKLCPEAGILKCPLYVTVEPKFGHVYISDYENGVIGLDKDGNLIFSYNDTATKGYMGICSAPSGDVYICTFQPNGISKVQTENKPMGSLPPYENELTPFISLPNRGGQRPRSVAYSRKTNKIVISFVGHSVDVMSIYHT